MGMVVDRLVRMNMRNMMTANAVSEYLADEAEAAAEQQAAVDAWHEHIDSLWAAYYESELTCACCGGFDEGDH